MSRTADSPLAREPQTDPLQIDRDPTQTVVVEGLSRGPKVRTDATGGTPVSCERCGDALPVGERTILAFLNGDWRETWCRDCTPHGSDLPAVVAYDWPPEYELTDAERELLPADPESAFAAAAADLRATDRVEAVRVQRTASGSPFSLLAVLAENAVGTLVLDDAKREHDLSITGVNFTPRPHVHLTFTEVVA